MSMHESTEIKECRLSLLVMYHYWIITLLNRIGNGYISNLESNFGKHIGVQFSECLNDSEELTKLKIRCKSAG